MPGKRGMLPIIIPNPIGISSSGSHSFFMARYMNSRPMRIITMWPKVTFANPV